MKQILGKLVIIFIFTIFSSNLYSDVPYYVDFKLILNQSVAGKKAQSSLKSKLNQGLKKLIKPEDYKSKVNDLRSKVLSLQKERNKLLENVSKQRAKAKTELLKNLNPIISEYMQSKKIRMVVDKKSILMADQTLDITKEIMDLLNKRLKSIKLN